MQLLPFLQGAKVRAQGPHGLVSVYHARIMRISARIMASSAYHASHELRARLLYHDISCAYLLYVGSMWRLLYRSVSEVCGEGRRISAYLMCINH